MARRFAKVSEEEIEEAFYPSDLVNTKKRVGEERWIYTHQYSPPLWGIVVCYFTHGSKVRKAY